MGLHLKQNSKCSPIESEVKLRIFWTIQKMDISMSAILGYPKILDLDTIDQELPTEVDDENITETGRNGYPGSTPSASLQAANAHLQLILILDKVIKFMYPNNRVEGSANEAAATAHVVDHGKVREIEEDLRLWCQGLPVSTPSDRSEEVYNYRTQKFLSLAFAHVQMMLYRPFLSFVSDNTFGNENKNKMSQACTSAYYKVCQNVVQIVKEVQKRGIVVGPSWFMINITSFATLSLVYFNCQRSKSSAPLDIPVDAPGGLDVAKLIAQRKRDACIYFSAIKTLSKQISTKTKSTVGTTVVSIHSKEICPASATLADEREPIQTRSGLCSIVSELPNCEPTYQALESDSENSSEISKVASITRQDSISIPCDTPDDVIFQLINFEGNEGFEAQNDSRAGTPSPNMGSVQYVSTEPTDLAVECMSMDSYLQSWKYDNGVPDLDEMIETGICLAESRNGPKFNLKNQRDDKKGSKASN
ncbi:unnamed protein product [Blumeria hordei]|uniref:Xylanolytic transcriptional activator regulatory domain-containing protein n=1 Tax=Blumeria hordei TaxID=2867405 RepID=A0A383V0R2_BLUHO|nr:unnamed protein product [Blumeria hordei]